MRLLERYSTLYTSFSIRVSRIGAKLVCFSTTSKQAKVAPEHCHAVQGWKWRCPLTGRRTEKLTERFVGHYKIKRIISLNAVELELPSTVKIHLVVNISRIRQYVGQVEGQRKEQPAPVIIEGEEEWKVERILNK